MGFLPDLLNPSFLRSVLLWSLWSKLLFTPEYNWPSDYLTRTTSCTTTFSFFTGFKTVCDNACDLSKEGTLPTFDYIIVGSGAAGSLLAYRLTLANPNRKVLLIESGSDPIIESVPPPLFAFNFNNSATYAFNAEASPNYGNAFKSGVNCNCGKSAGGTTEMNAMMFVCGCDENYNYWATIANDPSWNYTNILPYIKKSHSVQDSTGSLLAGNCGAYQGTNGPLVVTNTDSTSDFIVPILKNATMELNYPQKNSANCGPPYTGFANIPMSIYNGQRESAARAFLVPLYGMSNLYFMRNSTVASVITSKDPITGVVTATGVNVITKFTKCPNIVLKATREVIVSAGAYNSPLILQRSGIGKAADLSAFGINQVKDLPVGKNLMDHPIMVSFWTIPGFTPDNFSSSAYFSAQATSYLYDFSGYFSRFQGLNYGGFINTLNSSANCPDVQIVVSRYEQNMPDMDILMNNKWEYKTEYANQLLNVNKNYALVQVFTTVLQPKSRGTVNLRSTDPYAPPVINGNYFSDPSDLDTLVRGMLTVCNIFNTTAAKNAGINPFILNITECNSLTFCTDSYIRCYAKYFTMNLWHPSGTCKMGSSTTDSVVDSRLRVFGVKHLRVADASIMPVVTAGNTQCPTYTIAEKAADMVIADNP